MERQSKTKNYILGIESSCDETCVAIVADGRELVAECIASSADIQSVYGGVVPEIASRKHLELIVPLLRECLDKAKLKPVDLAAVAVCAGPGLIGSLLVGVSAAKAFASVHALDLVPVHHLAGHVAANYIASPELTPPFLCLIISGAHSHLVAVEDYCQFKLLGRSRDDAPGEAFDKIAREIGLGYPGGPRIDRAAALGNASALKLPQVKFADNLDFSFSGLKTAVLNELNRAEQKARREGLNRPEILSNEDIAASFQRTVAETLCAHVDEALVQYPFKALVLAGGVSANSEIRKSTSELCAKRGVKFYCPPLSYCTDNGAMIAAQGYSEWKAGKRADSSLNASALINLEDNC